LSEKQGAELEGRTALVTGGSGRLGSQIAAVLHRRGARVATLDARPPGARRSSEIACYIGDVTEPDSVRQTLEQIQKDLAATVDILVNAHGVFPNTPALELSTEEWQRVFEINVRGTFVTCQCLARQWQASGTRGSIVNLGSAAADSPRPGGTHYSASKAAVHALTGALAIELGPFGIRVNAVAPGLVLDEVVSQSHDITMPYVKYMVDATPLGRTGSPEEIAETVAFLASPRSGWTTGAVVEVTGGSHCGRASSPLSGALR
jgi:NAD(P)-dependent dehydrogenase (short-subunit alcohol dehydrogenase family)